MAANDSPSTAASRTPLPDGTIPVAIGLLISGIGAFLFLKVGQDALGSEHAMAPITSLWFATFGLAPGFFLPMEQELARALSHRRAVGHGGWPVVRKVAILCVALAAVVAVAIAGLWPVLSDAYFSGNNVMVLALLIGFLCYAPAHLARGISSGTGRFVSYSLVMAGDGVMRIAACLVLAALGATTAGPYGLAIAFAPLPAVIFVASRGWLHTEPGPEAEWNEVTPNLGWLLLGSVFAAGLVNAGPIAAALLSEPGEEARVTQFGKAVLIARIPLFMFQAVQAALLPRLSRLAARDQIVEFRSGLTRLLKAVLVVAVVGTVGAYVLGPFILRTVMDTKVGNKTMALLALGAAMYMFALALAQAVIALRGHALVALGWGIGMITLVLVTWLSSDDLFRRIELGLVCSSVAALAAFAIALRHLLGSGRTPHGGDVIVAITDMPLES